ncbi:MAG: FkbM family methyltransferase, partial [Clostridia bacterium]|nr:FkbM family methyltransferase [Clostridia bacterium]
MRDVWHKLQEHKGAIVLYGMGNGAEIMVEQLKRYGISVDGFFASDGFVRGQHFMGERVMSFKEAKERFPDMIALVSFGTSRQEVIDNILSLDVPTYAPEVPV